MKWNPLQHSFEYMGLEWHASHIIKQMTSFGNGPQKLTIEFVGSERPYQPQEEQAMNRSTTVFLVDNSVKALKAQYEDGGKVETFKTFDSTIKKDDILVVESGTRHGFTTVKVTEVDTIVDIEDSTVNVKWVVSKVDLADHKTILAQEAVAIDKVRQAEFNKKKRDLVANMASPEDAEALKSININPAIAPPQAADSNKPQVTNT